MSRTPEEVRAVVEPLATEQGLELVEVECKGPAKRPFVRVLIHKPGGVSVQDCQRLSSSLSRRFNEGGGFFFPGHCQLEVASPGLDRPLKSPRDFARNLGAKVRVFLKEAHEGKVEWLGRIRGVEGERLRLALEETGEERELGLAEISRGKLVIEF